MERRPQLARRIEAAVRAELSAREGLWGVLEGCGPDVPREARAELAGLPFEAERERLALWLLGTLERDPPPQDVAELRFRVARNEWRGRLDGADLEFGEVRAVRGRVLWRPAGAAGSAVLARIARLLPFAGGDEPASGALLALAYAALAAQELLARVDPALTLGASEERAVSVEVDGGPLLALGHLDAGGWNRAGFGLRTMP